MRMAETLAIVHQNDAIVARLVVMPIAVLDEKIKYRHIDEVEQPWLRYFRLLYAVCWVVARALNLELGQK